MRWNPTGCGSEELYQERKSRSGIDNARPHRLQKTADADDGEHARDLLVLAPRKLLIDGVETDDLLLELGDLLIEARHLGLRYISALRSLAVRGLELSNVAGDALVDALEAALHLRLGEVFVTGVHRLELRAVYGDARFREQLQISAKRDEGAAHLTDWPAVVLAEIGDGLEVGREPAGQPHQLNVALTFAF